MSTYQDYQGARKVPVFILCQYAEHLGAECSFTKNEIGCQRLDHTKSVSTLTFHPKKLR